MEYIWIIENEGSKMVDGSSSLFSNKWRHHDIIAIVKDHLCWSYQRPYYLRIFRLREIWIPSINSVICRHCNVRSSYAQKLQMMTTLLCIILVDVGWAVLKL